MAKKAKEAQKEESAALVPVISAKAMSKDIGPLVLKQWAQMYDTEQEVEKVLMQVDAKRYDLLSHLTVGIVKAARNEKSIDLTVAFMDGPEGAKAMGHLNDQIGLALGFKEVQTINQGTPQEKKRVAWSKDVASIVLASPEEKGTPAGKRKETIRSNFGHALKKCIRTACGIIENKIDAKMDKKEGTLLLSGPAIKSQFGAPSVHLNEKQKVLDEEGKVVRELTERPSFTAIAAKAAEAHGAVVKRGSNTRGKKIITNPTQALADIAKSFISIVNKIGTPNDKQIEVLKGVRDVLDKVLV
jgi:hypothetical protein